MDSILNYNYLNKYCLKLKKLKKRIVLAHGTFDVLHVGHVKHLKYGKKFGDKLIVTITADKFVKKGNGRPYFKDIFRNKI